MLHDCFLTDWLVLPAIACVSMRVFMCVCGGMLMCVPVCAG